MEELLKDKQYTYYTFDENTKIFYNKVSTSQRLKELVEITSMLRDSNIDFKIDENDNIVIIDKSS